MKLRQLIPWLKPVVRGLDVETLRGMNPQFILPEGYTEPMPLELVEFGNPPNEDLFIAKDVTAIIQRAKVVTLILKCGHNVKYECDSVNHAHRTLKEWKARLRHAITGVAPTTDATASDGD